MVGVIATNCTFSGNSSSYGGGGMNSGTAINCVFASNSAAVGGGGIYGGIARNCIFTSNTTAGNGGGMYGTTATNCVLFANSATSGNGGGAYSNSLYFCTVVNNFAGLSGGGVYLGGGTVTNCIVWGNTVGGSSPNITGSGTVTYSDIQRGFTGTGNINSNPQFVSQSTGNLHLSATSPCINTGTSNIPSGFTSPATDLDGGKRIIGTAPDIGAYEFGNIGVFGTLAFDGISALAPAQNVTFQFRPANGGAATAKTYFTTSDGAFYLYGVPDGTYNLWVKSPTYLSALVPITITGGIANITATLEPGDANNDNSVDSTDFGVLIGAFNTMASVPGSGYDPTADFNGDGVVDSSDFGLLIGNFNTVGAP